MFSNEFLNSVTNIICDSPRILFDDLEIKVTGDSGLYKCRCPIHDGDNENAITIYTEGYSKRGHFICHTHHCEKKFHPTIIGFVRGCLSRKNGMEAYSFYYTIEYLCKLYKISLDGNTPEKGDEFGKYKFAQQILKEQKPVEISKLTRTIVRSRLKIPSNFFASKGYLPETLEKYDIGYCDNPKSAMYCRSVVPVYDDNHEFMVGCLGRSIFEQCPKCKWYHHIKSECKKYPKWRNQKDFETKSYLFNFWFAKEYIIKSGEVILTESVGNVLRLEESGIYNSLGTFGAELPDSQKVLLEKLPIQKMTIIADNDINKVGITYALELKQQLSKLYDIKVLLTPKKDVGIMQPEEVKKWMVESGR